MTRARTLLLLLAASAAADAARTTSAKWAQTRDGGLVVVVQVKRKEGLCTGETASVATGVLRFEMHCGGELFSLAVELEQAVDESSVVLRRERAQAIVTMRKAAPASWWSSLAKEPSKYKKLLERDFTRGDAEPEDEDEEAAASAGDNEQVAVDAEGNVVSREEAAQAQAEAEVADALETARKELQPKKKVQPKTVSTLKSLCMGNPKRGDLHLMLGYLLMKRGDEADAIPLLRKAIKLEPKSLGAHQTLGQVLMKNADAEKVAEASRLYRAGSHLLPADAETYYQLGRTLNMPGVFEGSARGGKSDEAAAAWRGALKAKPDMVEAHQMLALRLSRAKSKKSRAVAKQHAARALKLSPDRAMSYFALGSTLAAQEDEPSKLKAKTRQKAIDVLRTALVINGDSADDGAPEFGHEGKAGMARHQEADCRHTLGTLFATKPNAGAEVGNSAINLFRSAARLEPTNKRYAESVLSMEQGVASYNQRMRDMRAEEGRKRQAALEAKEDAEIEEEEDEYSDQRLY